jgi:hypothetical protein
MRLSCVRLLRHILISLLLLSSVACSQDRDEIAYDMVARITGGSDIDHVAVRFVDVRFYWEWGGLGEGGSAAYSHVYPQKVPKSLVLSWEKGGKKFEMPFTIEMPPPEMIESIRNSGVNVNGHIDHSTLELMFEITPDQNTARVYWHESKFPPLSPPKDTQTDD